MKYTTWHPPIGWLYWGAGWLTGLPKFSRGWCGRARDEHHVGNGWSQFSSIIYLLLPLLNPRLKVKPMKIIIGLWDVSNYVLHPPDFTGKGNGIQKEQRNWPKSHNCLAADRSCLAFCFLTYLMKGPTTSVILFFLWVGMTCRLFTVMQNTISAQDGKPAWEPGTHVAINTFLGGAV